MNILCLLFGHNGEDSESGFHVCYRCGMHEYWDSREISLENRDIKKFYYERSIIDLLPNKLLCFWFGHLPSYERDHVPCARCGLHDVDYHDQVSPSRHEIVKDWFKYWFFRKWFPVKCPICGKRYDCSEDVCIPF